MSEMIKVPDGWEVTEFKNLVNNKTKKSNPLEDSIIVDLENIEQNNGELIFNSLIRDYPKDKIAFKKQNILFGKLRPYLRKYWYCSFEGSCTSELLVLEAKKNIESKYVFYVIQNEIFLHFADRFSYGTKMPRVSFNDLAKYKCSVPKEKKEQEKIAKILSTLDKSIESTNRLIEKEKHIKTALMQELLTNGIDQNGQIRTKATHTYKPTELGLIPDEWEVVSLKEVMTIQYGKDQKEVEEESGKFPILGSGGVIGYTNHFLYDKPSVLIGRKGTIDNPRYMDTPFWTVDTLFYSHIKSNSFPKWVFYIFQTINWRAYNEASGVPSLSTSNINSVKIKKPLKEEQKQIAKILTTQDKKIETEETNLAKLKELKKGLMNDLLSGKVRVKYE